MADMEFALVFTGEVSDLKAASNEAREAVSSVSNEANRSVSEINNHAAALEKEASAALKAADANAANATATKRAREEAAKAAGAPSVASPSVPAQPQPRRPGANPQPPSEPKDPPANDNAGRARRQVLGYQVFDIAQGVTSGMPLQMVAAQQLPQIAQMYTGAGGVNTALEDFRTIGAGVLRLFTPLTVGLGAVAAAAAVGVTSYSSYLASIKEVETAASGFGRAVAGTATEMEASARAGAAAAGVSVSAARSMQAQFLQSGKIGAEHYEGLIALSKDFAATVGTDAAGAGQALTEMFSDPAKAAQTLYRQYGLLDAATARQISNLAAQNRVSEAQGVLLDALPDKLADAERATTALGRAWDTVATGASNAFDWMGQAIDRAISGPNAVERIAQIDGLLSTSANGGGRRARINREALRAERDQLQAELDAEAERRRSAEENQRGAVSLGIAESSGANASAARERELRNQIAALQQGRSALPEGSDDRRMVDTAIEAKTRALDALINRQARSAELDQLEIRIANERNPLLRAELEERRVRLQLADQEISSDKIAEEAARARKRVIEETIASSGSQIADMRDELDIRQRLAAEVAGGSITQADANRLLQEELTLRPLVAAAAAAEGAEKERLLAVIAGLRESYAGLAAAQKDEAGQSIVRSQDERLQQLRAEAALIGQSDEVRRRSLALLEAEQQIRQEGIASDSVRADQIRKGATAIADQTAEVERLRDAWGEVQSAIESTIDNGVDKLLDGDFSGALESLKDELLRGLTTLSITNPLKNAVLGTNYGTMSDLGGIGGLVGRLFGGNSAMPEGIVAGAMQSVGSMSVAAGSVVVNGSVVGSAMSALGVDRMFSPANGNAPMVGGSDTQSQIWNFFAGKGLASHQIAGIMGNINAESAFNPLAVGDSGNALGLFQHNDRASALLAAIGGRGNLGNVGSQLDFAWNELNTSERASLQRLLASTDVRGATSAFAGFERPRGWSLSNPEGADNYVGRLKGAEAALERFGNTTTTATQGLGTLGTGFDKFGTALSSFQPTSGGSGGLFGSILSGLSSFGQSVFGSSAQFASAWQAGGVGLYSGGGYTGAGGVYEPRGIVHAGEVVWSQADVARHGGVSNVEAMRTGARFSGYASGGAVGVSALPYAANASRFVQREERMPSLQIINQTSTPITGEVQEGQDEGGRRQSRLIISDEMGAAAQQKGGGFQKAMSRQYGLRPRGIPR